MECIIPGANIKVISKSIQALAKLSDELHIEVEDDTLSLLSTNTAKTAFAKYTFLYTFFTSFNICDDVSSQEKINCKVQTKSILKIFKFKPHIEKKVELCKIELLPDASNIVFKFRYKHEINVVHQLSLIDFQTISISYKDTNMRSTIIGAGHLFMKILSDLQPNDSEINIQYSKDNAVIRNYDTANKNVQRGVRSQMTLASKEFILYNIKEETSLTFSLKPFRSAIHFADVFNLNITWKIESAGRPTVISMRNSTFNITYVVSTANIDGVTQSTNSSIWSVSIEENLPKEVNNAVEINYGIEVNNVKNLSDKPRASFSKILNNLLEENVEKEVNLPEVSLHSSNSLIADRTTCVSPQTKRIKMIFSECFEKTFSETIFCRKNGIVLAPNSDTESD